MAEEVKNEQVNNEEVVENENVDNPTTEESENKTEETKEETKQDEKTFTQSELEDIISKRLERERKKFQDYDDIKKKASEYEKELEEKRLAELSEKERAEEIAKKAEEEKSGLANELEELRQSVKQEKINNEFIKLATNANIQYIDDALKLADLSAVNVNEEGKVEGVDTVIESLVQDKPFLVATKKQTKPIGESTNSNQDTSDKTADQLLKEAAEKAKNSNRIEDKIAYSQLKKQLGR